MRSTPLRRGTWPSRYLQSVAPNSAQSCTSAYSSLASLHLGASRVAQLAAALRFLAVPLRAESRAWFSSKLHRGPQPPRVTLHLGASRVAQLAAAPRPLAVPLRAWRSAWFSPKLHSGPQPPRITPPQSVACSTARRCAAALGCPAAGIAWRLVQAKAGRPQPTYIADVVDHSSTLASAAHMSYNDGNRQAPSLARPT